MWMVEVETTDVFRFGAPVLMFDSPGWTGSGPFGEPFDVAQGDDRFLIARSVNVEEGDGPPFVLVNNFVEELKQRVPE